MSEDPEFKGTPCMVELDVKEGQMTKDVLQAVEKTCNSRIREHCPVNVKVFYSAVDHFPWLSPCNCNLLSRGES